MKTPLYNNQDFDPELKDLLELYKRDTMLSTNCHALATVLSFNPNDTSLSPARPTITAMLNYPRTVFYQQPDQQTPQPTTIPYSQLVSVPIVVMSGGGGGSIGGASLTFPIALGDQVLILFNDRSIDNWKSGLSAKLNGNGGLTPNNTSLSSSRTHHLSDGLAIVGFPLFPTSSANYPPYSSTYALLSNGAAQVGVGNGKVLITNDPAQVNNLNAILQSIITNIKALVSATAAITVAPGSFSNSGGAVTGVSGTPENASTINNIATQLTDNANSLAALLE
jgi:hypothetical protein